MTSRSRAALAKGLEGLRIASLEPAVRASDPAGEMLRRGLAVSSYNLLETFVDARVHELATFVNQGHLHFADLPERVQQRATRHLLDVAGARVRRLPPTDVRSFVETVGQSLVAVSGPVNLSALTWLWPGSNMNSDDYAALLKLFHVQKPWDAITTLASRLGLPPGDPQTELQQFGLERNRAAHDSSHQVSSIWIPHAINLVVKFAVTFDAFASVASGPLRRAERAYLDNPDWTSSVVGIRRVVERRRDWAEFAESGQRAYRTGPDKHALLVDAATRCSDRDLLTVVDVQGQLTEWSVPLVG
ncbi:hypothetical protein HP550_19955 [Cellulomonas humilata]|uniref:RiboL-PSP-HEPN domain-containing protein n=1 Tax=Cellulomonas humilata TaxID=144055 RepID=A0A7Y6A4B8_9CELL|nr:hypothetical protein [Cellulomonas humilata]NUU19529.1 hypothetical protein [Cellulomonas humilata]